MLNAKLIPGLADPNPAFLCRNLRVRGSDARYRVPVTHRVLTHTFTTGPDVAAGLAAVRELRALLPGHELCDLVSDAKGLGLWVPRNRLGTEASIAEDASASQDAWGAVLVVPPHEWAQLRDGMADWFGDDADEIFAELPYTFEDVLPFAGLNFSPDRWFVVLRGEMAGKVCWWTHDGDSVMDQPWADDIQSWAMRVWKECPEVFGGIMRFGPDDTVDPCPSDAELYPESYLPSGER